MPARRCQFCAAPLEPVQEFRYLVETATLDEPTHLARIRALPSDRGRPLRVCGGCQRAMAAHPARFRAVLARREARAGLLAAVAALSLGLVVAAVLGEV